jgi:caa(3)-type oxidase subunit IV
MESSSHHLSARSYAVIYEWLLVLTAVEIAIAMSKWPERAIVIGLVSSAMAKALLIALYFMHLRFDRRVVWALPAIPLGLGACFILALFPDIVLHWPLNL